MEETTNFYSKAKSTDNNDVDFLFYLNLAVIQGEYLIDGISQDSKKEMGVVQEADNTEGETNETRIPLSNQNIHFYRYTNFAKKIKEKLQYICKENYSLIDVDILPYLSLLAVLEKEEYNVPLSVSTNGAISEKDETQKQEAEKQELIDLLTLNLFIADYDENLESDKSCEKNLKKIKSFLKVTVNEENKATLIKKILLYKAEYLLFKVRYRSKPFRKLKYDKSVLLTKEDKILDKDHDLYVSPENVFFEFVKKTIDHYEKEEEKNGEKEELISEGKMSSHFKNVKQHFESSEITGIKISDFFEYNRYLKKVNIEYPKKIEKLETIIGEVDKRIIENNKEPKNYFYDLALKSCRNLLHNTKFRLYLEEKEKKIETELFNESFYQKSEITDLTTFFEDIKEERKNIPKYFDYKQFETLMLFFDRLIEGLTNQEKILSRFTFLNDKQTEDDISKYDDYIKNIFTKINEIKKQYLIFLKHFQQWDLGSKDLGLLPIYLEKKACFISKEHEIEFTKFDKEKINVRLFLDSSYILPVDYSRIDDKRIEEKLQLDSKIETIKSKIEALYNYKKIQLETLRAGKQIDEFKDKLKDGEFKIVQIVALFVTIASFVLMQVKIYDNKSGVESIAITISLAGILVLFNGVFQWMIEGRRETKSGLKHLCTMIKTPVIFVSILLLIFGGILFIICKYNGWDIDSKENKMLQEKVTVLKETEKMRMDLKNYKYQDSMQNIEQNKKIDSIKKQGK